MKKIIAYAAVFLAVNGAYAAPITCLPKPFGTGSAALVMSPPAGQFVAWNCPGEAGPTVVACVKSNCSLVGTQRSIAAWASNPTIEMLREALKPYKLDPHVDPSLKAVWFPYAAQIKQLK